MFPTKIEFDGKKHRTKSYNKVLDVIFKDISQLYEKKEEDPDKKSASSSLVPGAGVYVCFFNISLFSYTFY